MANARATPATRRADDAVDRVGPALAPIEFVRRRAGGRFAVDPFGFDPQLTDFFIRPLTALPVDVVGGEHVPVHGPGAIVAHRGFGLVEPLVLALAVQSTVGRRVRHVGGPGFVGAAAFMRRFGVIDASGHNVAAALGAGRLLAVAVGATPLTSNAATPPLELVQAMMGYPVVAASVRPIGPLRAPTRWRVEFAEPVTAGDEYPPGDPLGAAELAEAVRDRVGELRQGLRPA